MCLAGRKNWFQRNLGFKLKPKKAKEDIVVYKLLAVTSLGRLVPPYRDYMEYRLGELYKSELDVYPNISSRFFHVEKGLHSFTDLKEPLRRVRDCTWQKMAVYTAVIPKGSKYYVGTCDEIVSDQLIVIDKYQ